jgi:hypothetical protein
MGMEGSYEPVAPQERVRHTAARCSLGCTSTWAGPSSGTFPKCTSFARSSPDHSTPARSRRQWARIDLRHHSHTDGVRARRGMRDTPGGRRLCVSAWRPQRRTCSVVAVDDDAMLAAHGDFAAVAGPPHRVPTVAQRLVVRLAHAAPRAVLPTQATHAHADTTAANAACQDSGQSLGTTQASLASAQKAAYPPPRTHTLQPRPDPDQTHFNPDQAPTCTQLSLQVGPL